MPGWWRTEAELRNSVLKRLSKIDFSNLLIDTREKNSKVVKFLQSKGVELKFQPLPVGDYYFPSEEILIERKAVSDLHKSLTQGRLYKQVDALVQTGKKILLLIEGDLGYGKIHPNGILGAQLSLNFRYQIPILRSENWLETINILLLILEKIKKGGYENTKTYYQKEFKADYIDDPQMKFLMTLPKCGEKTARAILEKFGNIKNFVNASDDQILQIPGVGPKLLEKWRQVLEK